MKLYVYKDKSGAEIISNSNYYHTNDMCNTEDIMFNGFSQMFILPKGSIKKLIGRELTWNDEPVKLEEE